MKALFQMTPQIARKHSEESQEPPSSDEGSLSRPEMVAFSPVKHRALFHQEEEKGGDEDFERAEEMYQGFGKKGGVGKFTVNSPYRKILLKSPHSMPRSKICSDEEELIEEQDSGELNPREYHQIMSAGPPSRHGSHATVVRHTPGASIHPFRTFVDVPLHAATDNEELGNMAEMESVEGEEILSEHVVSATSNLKLRNMERGLSDEDINHSHFSVTRKLNFKMSRVAKHRR